MRNLVVLLAHRTDVYCVFDIVRSTRDERLGVHPLLWIAFLVVVPLVGSLVWLGVRWSRRTAYAEISDAPPTQPARASAHRRRPTTTRTSCAGSTRTAGATTAAAPARPDPDPQPNARPAQRPQRPEYECLPVTTRLITVKFMSTTA